MAKKDKDKKKTQALETKNNDSIIRFVNSEKNIFDIGFFSAVDTKHTKDNKYKKITITRNQEHAKIELSAEIVASAIGHLPSISDQDKWFALMSLVDEEKKRFGLIYNPFVFSSGEILKRIGLADAGRNYREVEEWLDRMCETSIRSEGAVYIIDGGKKDKQYGKDRMRVFDRALTKGRILDDGTQAEENYVWFSEWQLKNINSNKSFVQVDLDEYIKVKNTLAKALIPVLQNWFYPDMVRELGYFEKRYDAFCQFFKTTEYKYLSQIKRSLKPSFDELVNLNHLRAWDIDELANEDGYKIIFYLGEKYIALDRFAKLVNPPTPEEASKKLLLKMQPESQPNQSTIATSEQESLIKQLIEDFQVGEWKAKELITNCYEETKRQLEAFKYRYDINLANKAGWIIEAIKNAYAVPETYIEVKRKTEAEEKRKIWQAKVNACTFCDKDGWLHLIKPDNKTLVHRCDHTQDLINQLANKGLRIKNLTK